MNQVATPECYIHYIPTQVKSILKLIPTILSLQLNGFSISLDRILQVQSILKLIPTIPQSHKLIQVKLRNQKLMKRTYSTLNFEKLYSTELIQP